MWHEIATWFGYKMTGFYPEFGSAFSWEDMYSNLLGCHVGYLALYDNEHSFDRAVTVAAEAELPNSAPSPSPLPAAPPTLSAVTGSSASSPWSL